ncbi:MAG: histidinol-phosphate transaminase [Lachnospiraceae bacterium]|nr:histidinol-phosphate transaminase [Lachnospiraceae bacterium]
MKKEWEENLRSVIPYTPGEQPKDAGIIKLNTNENPYPPSPLVGEALLHLDEDALRKYPDPTIGALCAALAKRAGLEKDQVFVGIGSDDVLAMSFMAFFNSERPILFPDITYSFYDVWAELFRIPYRLVPLDEEFRICTQDYRGRAGGIVIPNPNAPTGLAMGVKELEQLVLDHPECVVIIDEAYVDFGAGSMLPLINRYENLLVVQTFSKSRSMAGMRIGAAYGSRKLIKTLLDVKYSFNSYTLNAPAIAAGVASLKDEQYFAETIEKIIATRERTKQELSKLGFVFPDSSANFLFVTHPDLQAAELFGALRKEKIFVRYFDKPRIDRYLRSTIGRDEEMDALIAFLKNYLKQETERRGV